MNPINTSIKEQLNSKLAEIEKNFNADVISYTGPILYGLENTFLTVIEELALDKDKKDTLFVILTTDGGSAEVVERCVNIIRHHYTEVNFIVPDYAYSSGTIFCMSGDSIYMDYYSVLGPIDPQVQNKEGKLVAALGYLDKINELLSKAATNTLTDAEFLILKDFDLAELRGYEQAKDLTIDLLKKWLVQYKFKNWTKHRTDVTKLGKSVTVEEKEQRAEEIAGHLSNNNRWKTHGRPINIDTLKGLRLEVEDYSRDTVKRPLIRLYYDLLSDYIMTNKYRNFTHSRLFI